MPTADLFNPPPAAHPLPWRSRAVLFLCVGLGGLLSAMGLLMALINSPMLLVMAAFCAVTLVSSGLLVTAGIGRGRSGYGLGMLTTAGAFFTSAVLVRFSTTANFTGATPAWFKMWVLGMLVLAVILTASAALDGVARRAGSLLRAVIGASLLIPAACVGGYAFAFGGLPSGSGPIGWGIATLVAALLAAVTIAGIHVIIGAYERAGPRPVGSVELGASESE